MPAMIIMRVRLRRRDHRVFHRENRVGLARCGVYTMDCDSVVVVARGLRAIVCARAGAAASAPFSVSCGAAILARQVQQRSLKSGRRANE
jgi:hypothetical protein